MIDWIIVEFSIIFSKVIPTFLAKEFQFCTQKTGSKKLHNFTKNKIKTKTHEFDFYNFSPFLHPIILHKIPSRIFQFLHIIR